MKFLLEISDRHDGRRDRFPLRGSEVDIADLDALLAFQDRHLDGGVHARSLIVHPAGWTPWWAEYADLDDKEEAAEDHRVHRLPEGWEGMRWVEIYNGRRE